MLSILRVGPFMCGVDWVVVSYSGKGEGEKERGGET
jgi:hypothetical protein